MSEQRVSFEVADHVADVRLTRAEKLNALDYPMFEALNEAVVKLAETEGIRAAVLSGEGRSFCAGLDFASVMGDPRMQDKAMFSPQNGSPANFYQRPTYGFLEAPVPVIAALRGHCLGGGSQLALAADIRIAAPDTKLCVKEIQFGLIPDMGITTSLPRLVRADVAKELVWSGRTVEAAEALELGLVTRIAEDPHAEAMALAREIAQRNPDAIQADKRLLEQTWNADNADALALEAEIQQTLIGSPNQGAAVQSSFSGEPAEFSDPAR